MTRGEERLAELLHAAAPPMSGVSFDEVVRKVRRHHAVAGAVAVVAVAAVAAVVAVAAVAATIAVVAAAPGGGGATLIPESTASASATAAAPAGLPPDAVIPHGCDTVLSSLPHAPTNAAHLPPEPGDRPIDELQAICVAEKGAIDVSLTHPAWAWLATRAQIANYGWDGCTCNNPDRQVWVVAVAGPARTDGSPGTPPRRSPVFSVVLDAATGQGTDETIGSLLLPGGRTVRMP